MLERSAGKVTHAALRMPNTSLSWPYLCAPHHSMLHPSRTLRWSLSTNVLPVSQHDFYPSLSINSMVPSTGNDMSLGAKQVFRKLEWLSTDCKYDTPKRCNWPCPKSSTRWARGPSGTDMHLIIEQWMPTTIIAAVPSAAVCAVYHKKCLKWSQFICAPVHMGALQQHGCFAAQVNLMQYGIYVRYTCHKLNNSNPVTPSLFVSAKPVSASRISKLCSHRVAPRYQEVQ